LARKIVRYGWPVRRVEKAVKTLLEPIPKPKASIDHQTRWLEQQLAHELGEKVLIRPGPHGSYVLQLPFGDLAKLSTGLRRLQELVQQLRTAAGPRARDPSS
jgi:hypothetical protein